MGEHPLERFGQRLVERRRAGEEPLCARPQRLWLVLGSGAAAAASLAAATIGTETDGSIICPSSINGLVGFKPTLGLVSRTHVIPISHSQDTAGPMARSVTDAALLLTALAGSDPADPATAEADRRKTDYAAGLSPDYLNGVRIGVLMDRRGGNARVQAAFAAALEKLKAAAPSWSRSRTAAPGSTGWARPSSRC